MLYSPEASARQFPGGAFSLEGSPGEGRGGGAQNCSNTLG